MHFRRDAIIKTLRKCEKTVDVATLSVFNLVRRYGGVART